MNRETETRRVMEGVKAAHDGMKASPRKRFKKPQEHSFDYDNMAEGVRSGSRLHLGKAITLLESSNPEHKQHGQELLNRLLPHTGNSIRIGITGVPGAGKSTFIETFGEMLTALGHRVAVLAIDPSSSITGGSILGDKTRMENLARNPKAFIRPSPTAGTLGGVHKKTRETMLLCEAAGYDVILVETVGVGQSETLVRGMVDIFMLLVLTGAGDELQGMKKGILELADAIIVHKADSHNAELAKKTVREYKQILHFLQRATEGWKTQALPASSLEGTGISEIWDMVKEFENTVKSSGYWKTRRQNQTKDWFNAMITDELLSRFYGDAERRKQVGTLEQKVLQDQLTVAQAIAELFE
ncbi:methylmalonyl Co-A mutase-associated GTPase MeaB [Planococcus liqunii]|uniref:Methylmalonyl Co-A mutase-associated GTPase MeaB n=1 Tax=Planococcus liqunii TaxID=3058394 RepID=A0ABT8MPG5_9BACL|nr:MULTISPECIES: methylmalonyl Co-A mutase-associated GTPase MeaB [unclassified Planococcus (in: firmicutes)]MDN7226792.1 methylmalonyl Co-A mutase-associated GTPase MeaB [Planococcus sp. N064]WKA52612.1 methylmalonyl Co-A mutase-associated GTPase MeaB [Planococcus sp. N056]